MVNKFILISVVYRSTNASAVSLFVLILLAVLFGVAVHYSYAAEMPLVPSIPNPSNYAIYENCTFGLKADYPWWWKKIEDPRGVWFRTVNDSANVRFESISYPNSSLDSLVDNQTKLVNQQFPGQVLLESNKTSIGDNYEAYRLVFIFPEVPADLNNKVKEMQVGTLNSNRAYIVSYFTSLEAYDNYLPIVEKIINSFRVISVCA